MTSSERNKYRLLELNGRKGLPINQRMGELHKDGDEFALLRKEIRHIEEVLNITPTEEFAKYNAEAESIKAEERTRLAEARQSLNQ